MVKSAKDLRVCNWWMNGLSMYQICLPVDAKRSATRWSCFSRNPADQPAHVSECTRQLFNISVNSAIGSFH